MSSIKELQQQLEIRASALNKLQKGNIYFKMHKMRSLSCRYNWSFSISIDIAKNHQVRRQYTIQQGENEMVQKVSCGYMLFLLCFLLKIVLGSGS